MNKIFKFIENQKELVIELQKGLTACPAVNPENNGVGELEKFTYLKYELKKWKFDSLEEIMAPDERVPSKVRPSLIATINGKDTSRNLWLIAHLDVVPPGDRELWDTDPYEATVIDDKIYGRGTEDNQQSLVSSLIAARALMDNNIVPEINTKLLFVADEEVGSEYGIQWILENKDLFAKDDLIITPDVGDPGGLHIEIAEKSILWLYFTIKGKQTHGSRPDLGINATKAASFFCVEMEKLYEKYNASDDLFDVPISTFEPTMRHNSITNMNTIPGQEIVGYDCRILPQYSLDEVLSFIDDKIKMIVSKFKVTFELDIRQKIQAPEPTPVDAPVIKKLQKSIKNVLGIDAKPIGIGGGTVAAYFRMRGYQAALWSTVDNTMHCPNEYSKISNCLKDAKVFADLMINK